MKIKPGVAGTLVAALLCLPVPGHSETYVGFGLGIKFPGELSDFSERRSSIFSTSSNYQSDNDWSTSAAFAYGIKLGHYLESYPWLGGEFQLYNRRLKIPRQKFSVSGSVTPGPSIIPIPSGQLETESDVFLTFGFLLMARVPPEWVEQYLFGFFQPYGGIGAGISYINFQDLRVYDNSGALVSSNQLTLDELSIGFLGVAGMNVPITERMKLFTEIKYHPLNVTSATASIFFVDQIKGDISDLTLMAGLTYSFNLPF